MEVPRVLLTESDAVDGVRDVEGFEGLLDKFCEGRDEVGVLFLLAELLQSPARGEVKVPAPRREGDGTVDVASLPLLVGRLDILSALLHLGKVDVPGASLVRALDVIARVAALALLPSTIAVPTLVLVGRVRRRPLDLLLLIFQAQFLLPHIPEAPLVRERPPELKLRLPPDHLAVLVDPVLEHPVRPIEVQRLRLPRRILRVHVQKRAGDRVEGDVELHLEPRRGRRVHVDAVQDLRQEVEAVLDPDEVRDREEGEHREEGSLDGPDAELGRRGGMRVEGSEALGEAPGRRGGGGRAGADARTAYSMGRLALRRVHGGGE
mmetsp:Transcript_26344/g.77890  ORF Transcript_26344/g.77890 Transcript_26344/m.77890 type:complete len:321 (-) Transcript_26344:209-1171(-)